MRYYSMQRPVGPGMAWAARAASTRQPAGTWTATGTATESRTGVGKAFFGTVGRRGLAVIDYEQVLTELREEKAACQYAYGERVPVCYVQALSKAINDLLECRDCAAEDERMEREDQQV